MYPSSGRIQLPPQFMYPQRYSYYPTPKTQDSWSTQARDDTSSQSSSLYSHSDNQTPQFKYPQRYSLDYPTSKTQDSWSTEAMDEDDICSQCSSMDGHCSDNQTLKSSAPQFIDDRVATTFHNLRAGEGSSHMARAAPDVYSNMYHGHQLVAPAVVPAVGNATHVFHHPQQQPQQPSSAAMSNTLPNRGIRLVAN